ncbi:hypothetical protein ACLMJK_002691 [Lecanora helva]
MSRPTTPLPPLNTQKDPPIAAPARSSTHPIKPRTHLPHHPHRVHHHHHHHHDKSVPQTAVQPTTSNPFGDFLTKTTSGLHDGTFTPPRRNEGSAALKEERERRDKERAEWREVEKLKTRRAAVDDKSMDGFTDQDIYRDLRATLSTLSTLSTTTTRRLDYTYYSLLSSLSTLNSTLTSLQHLSTSTTTLSTHFTSDSNTLTTDIRAQISTAENGFQQQARRIADLELRMKRGREKVQGLGERLEVVRGKVEGAAERDREGRRRVGRRLRVLWCMLGVFGGLVLVGMVVRHWPRVGVETGEGEVVERGGDVLNADRKGRDWGGRDSRSSSGSSVQMTEAQTQDPILRLFDEL